MKIVSGHEVGLFFLHINVVLCSICGMLMYIFLCFAVALCTGPDLTALNGLDAMFILIQGCIVLPTAFTLLTLAPSYISAPEVSLYTLIETVLGPVWVYLGGFEAPPIFAVYGGIALIIALSVHR